MKFTYNICLWQKQFNPAGCFCKPSEERLGQALQLTAVGL